MRVALLAFLSAVVACDVGEVPINGGGTDGGSGPDPMMGQMFTASIKPMVDAMGCTAGGAAGTCHGNVQPPVFTTFETLTANSNYTYVRKPSAANRLVVGPLSLVAGIHQGVAYFDAAQLVTLSTWIDMYGAP
ncbi:MAG: hypothetical protein ACKV2T_43305 [Kofleriaceae bacterium]